MKKLLFTLSMLFAITISAQPPLIYGVSKVPGTTKIIYMSTIDPSTGFVNIISGPLASNHIGLGSGSIYDFTRGYYSYLCPGPGLTETNVLTGTSQIININPASCYLASPQFTCRDSSIYGIKSCPNLPGAATGFGKFDVATGTFISLPLSVTTWGGEDYTYDKINHRYIFTSGTNLFSIDLNTMNIDTFYLPITSGNYFRHLQYNCNDSLVYGAYSIQGTSSPIIYLATFNLNTNSFNVISTSPFCNGGIMGGGGSLDIKNNLYYYNVGTSIISVNINNGSVVNTQPYTFSIPGPTYVFYIQIHQTCDCEKPNSTDVIENTFPNLQILNPVSDEIKIFSDSDINGTFTLYDLALRLVIQCRYQKDQAINISNISNGSYIYTLELNNHLSRGVVLKQ